MGGRLRKERKGDVFASRVGGSEGEGGADPCLCAALHRNLDAIETTWQGFCVLIQMMNCTAT